MSEPMEDVEVARCTGHCCKRFNLVGVGVSHEELSWQPTLDSMVARGDPVPWGARRLRDGAQVARMLVPIERITASDDGKALPGARGTFYWYRCSNLLPNGNCGIYATRPEMCRDFPYDGASCPFTGCTRRCERQPAKPASREPIDPSG